MSYRTDVVMKNGKLAAANHDKGADTAFPLPQVESSDLLASDKWGESWQKQAQEHSDDPALRGLAEAQAGVHRTFHAFKTIREQQSPEITQAAHLERVAKDYDRSMKQLADKADRAQAQAKARLESLESEFRESVKWSDRDNQELRSVLRGMDDKQRQEVVGAAINDGDGQMIAAVLGSHPALSGIDAKRQKALRAQAMQKHRPDLYRLESALSKASEGARQAFLDLLERSDKLTAADIRANYQQKALEAAEARKRVELDY